jgi:hypothetical protein
MAGFSTYLAQQIINEKFVSGSTKYLALFVADPTDDNVTANEVSGAWYGRQAISGWSAPVGSGTLTANSNQLTYNAVTGSATSVTHWGIYDALTAGNLVSSGAWPSTKVLNVDDVFVVEAGDIELDFQ